MASKSASPPRFKIQAVTLDDVPAVAQMNGDAFLADRQTQMKALGKEEPFDMKQYTLQDLPGMLGNPRCVVVKVVDEDNDNAIMGYCNWAFRGFAPEEMPVVEGRIQPAAQAPPPQNQSGPTPPEPKPEPATVPPPPTDPIKRLEAHTDADMKRWMDEVMPAGTRCLPIIGLTVAPQYQGRGVGSALLRFGTDFCDKHGVFAWVHSSEPAWKMYEKSGFQVIQSLDVDLDEYAPAPPPASEGPGAVWGHYVFRYMKYLPRESGA